MGESISTPPYQVRGYTLYRRPSENGVHYGMFRHAPADASPAPLPDTIRVVFDQHGVPLVRARLPPGPVQPAAVLI